MTKVSLCSARRSFCRLRISACTETSSDEAGRKPPQDKLRDVSTTDHAQLKPLQKEFTSGPEVTAACLVCHDTTGTYAKVAMMAGHPPLDPVPGGAQTITGGDNVKHGDLSSALYTPDKAVDVHMAADGMNFTCSTCHS